MMVFSASGASVFTMAEEMVLLEVWRCNMSPVSRWEKNAMGRRITFHM